MVVQLPSKRRVISICTAFAASLMLLYLLTSSHELPRQARQKTQEYLSDYAWSYIPAPKHRASSSKSDRAFRNAFAELYRPYLHSIQQRWFLNPNDGINYTVNDPITWSKPIGKRLCIIDVDSRPHNETGHLLSGEFVWEQLERGVSPGIYNHWLYAAIHGYDYHFIHVPPYTEYQDRINVWQKVPALASFLPQYDIVVMLDPDALFMHMLLPYEWLMNRWNITPETSLTLPYDTGYWGIDTDNKIGNMWNDHGDLNPNAGFITALNLPRTYEILRAWDSCPDDGDRYPGCSSLRQQWPAEQGALGGYVRYEYNLPTDIHIFDGPDGNGFPWQGTDCTGRFIRHFTTAKDHVKPAVSDIVMQSLMDMSRGEFMREDLTVERVSNDISEDAEGRYPKFWGGGSKSKGLTAEDDVARGNSEAIEIDVIGRPAGRRKRRNAGVTD